jgi:aryl-alcohol dehydrogenase-like predicted oxidoreductase
MTFGEQVSPKSAFEILDLAFDLGINFIDTAEMYPVPVSSDKYGLSESIIGEWFKRNPIKQKSIFTATKIAGPTRGAPWIRNGAAMTPSQFEIACNQSLRRLNVDVIDLYQIHWPLRHVPTFGQMYFDPNKINSDEIPICEQLFALSKLISEGKIRFIGLSNESCYGVHEFVRLAELTGLSRIVSVQNSYSLLNRSVENSLDESLYRLNLSLLAYSPLAFGLLPGKYDLGGFFGIETPVDSRLAKYESLRKQRWGRESALVVAKLYNKLAKESGLTPVQLAIGFCLSKWQVTSTIIGVTSCHQLNEIINSSSIRLEPSLMEEIDHIRLKYRDPVL